jgi:Domain of unknown function (DUF932)
MGGRFRFICCNGLVVGEVVDDIRIAHKGNVQGEVIEGAIRVLDQFEAIDSSVDAMQALKLEPREEIAFATAALALRFVELLGGDRCGAVPAGFWATFQRVQANVMLGGQPGRSAQGRRLRTRPVGSIDRGVSLNRALWMLAEEMRRLKQ